MKSESESRSVESDSLWPHRLYSPWNSPDQNTGVGSLSLLQGIFPTRGSNPGLLHCRRFFTSWATRKALRIYFYQFCSKEMTLLICHMCCKYFPQFAVSPFTVIFAVWIFTIYCQIKDLPSSRCFILPWFHLVLWDRFIGNPFYSRDRVGSWPHSRPLFPGFQQEKPSGRTTKMVTQPRFLELRGKSL